MTDPITLISSEFLKLDFTWALCLKQMLLIIVAINVSRFLYYINNPDKNNIEMPQDHEYERQQFIQQQRDRDARLYEHHKKIDSVISSRETIQLVNIYCGKCGGPYGTGAACQYCGAVQ